ncbi:UNVERIFIED_CONTAM: hypothetical protein Sindi_1306100 [Sesamum indicum]
MRFFHVIDKQRALEGCSWSFEKKILILNGIGPKDNPLSVDLNWCDFYVHIHERSLNWKNLGIAMHIGRLAGDLLEYGDGRDGKSIGLSLRIRVAINMNNPLKKAPKIQTMTVDKLI